MNWMNEMAKWKIWIRWVDGVKEEKDWMKWINEWIDNMNG